MAGSSLKESKRDSKGDMPVGCETQHDLSSCKTNTKTAGEACARQRLLCSGASISDSAEEDPTRNPSHAEVHHDFPLVDCTVGDHRAGTTLEWGVLWGLWVGLVASPGSCYATCRAAL